MHPQVSPFGQQTVQFPSIGSGSTTSVRASDRGSNNQNMASVRTQYIKSGSGIPPSTGYGPQAPYMNFSAPQLMPMQPVLRLPPPPAGAAGGKGTSMFNHFPAMGGGVDVGPLVAAEAARSNGNLGPAPTEASYPKLDRGAGRGGVGDIKPTAFAEMESMWLAGFLDADERSSNGAAAPLAAREYGRMFPGTMPLAGDSKASDGKPKKSFLTGQEIKRLREIEQAVIAERKAKGPSLVDRLASSAYVTENDRIRRVMSLRGEAGRKQLRKVAKAPLPKALTASVTSKSLDNLLFLERLEAQAAVVVQRSWRRFQRLRFWATFIEETASAIEVQRLWRGHCGRIRAKAHKGKKSALATKLQSMGRGKMARDKTVKDKAFQDAAAKDIQRLWRGWFFREVARKRRRDRLATLIQSVWRGAKGRARADKLFIDRAAIVIQRQARRHIAQKSYQKALALESGSAIKLQAIFRGWLGRKRRNRALWDVETEARRKWMSAIKAEETWADKEAAAIARLRVKEDVDGKLKALDIEWRNIQTELSEKEYDFVSLQMERIKLSPRAVEQGWSAQLDADVDQHRKWVSELKEKALFKVALPLRELRLHADRLTLRYADLVHLRERSSERWNHDRSDMWTRHNDMQWGSMMADTNKRAADEKRRWKVKYFTDGGKIDLNRQPGIPRDLVNFPGHENRTLTIGHGDILALMRADPSTNPFAHEDAARESRMRLAHALAARTAELGAARPDLKGMLGPRMITWGWGAGEDENALEGPTGTDNHDPTSVLYNTLSGFEGAQGQGAQFSVGTVGPLTYVGPPQSAGKPLSVAGTVTFDDTASLQSDGGARNPEATAYGVVGNVMTVGRHFAGEFASGSISDVVHAALSGIAGDIHHKHEPAESGNQKLKRLGAKTEGLTERVWKTSVSRYAGYGTNTMEMNAKNRPRSEVPAHVLAARAGYSGVESGNVTIGTLADGTTYEMDADGNPLPGSEHAHAAAWAEYYAQFSDGADAGASYGYGPDPYYGYGWGWGSGPDGAPAPLLEDGSAAEPAQAADGSLQWPVHGYAGWGQGLATQAAAAAAPTASETGRARNVPAYLSGRTTGRSGGPIATGTGTAAPATDTLMQNSQRSTTGQGLPGAQQLGPLGVDAMSFDMLPPAMRSTVARLKSQKANADALARLPPGLAGARRGAAAATIAAARQKGIVGHTRVTATVTDKGIDRQREMITMASASTRLDSIAAKVAAVSAQAELVQYGSLAKPLLDGMAHLAMRLAAADGTSIAVERADAEREARALDREAKLEAARAERSAARAKTSWARTAPAIAASDEPHIVPPPAGSATAALPKHYKNAMPAGLVLPGHGPAPKPYETIGENRTTGIAYKHSYGAKASTGYGGASGKPVVEPIPRRKKAKEAVEDFGPTPVLSLDMLQRTQAVVRARQASLAEQQPDLWADMQHQGQGIMGVRTMVPGVAHGPSGGQGTAKGEDISVRLAGVWSLMDELEVQRDTLRAIGKRKNHEA